MDTEVLGEIALTDSDGNDAALRELWREAPAVVVWLRHYG